MLGQRRSLRRGSRGRLLMVRTQQAARLVETFNRPHVRVLRPGMNADSFAALRQPFINQRAEVLMLASPLSPQLA